MKAQLVALATAAAILAATPAFAGMWSGVGDWLEHARTAQRHFLASNNPAPKSPHCRYVLSHRAQFGQKEVTFCRQIG